MALPMPREAPSARREHSSHLDGVRGTRAHHRVALPLQHGGLGGVMACVIVYQSEDLRGAALLERER